MRVAELIARLKQLPPDAEILGVYDSFVETEIEGIGIRRPKNRVLLCLSCSPGWIDDFEWVWHMADDRDEAGE